MAKSYRIATFNCENLFARYKFTSKADPDKAVKDGWLPEETKFEINNETEKKLTAKAIKAAKADVIALQEIENLDTLKRFRTDYLGGSKSYPYVMSVDGNDPRLIDVAVLSKYPIVKARSYQHMLKPGGKGLVFSRDCLEVDVEFEGGKLLTLFVNHLKSMMGGRKETREKRMEQCQAVKKIVTDRFGKTAGKHPFIILGDMNDYLETEAGIKTGIEALAKWEEVENVVERLDEVEQWTHYWGAKKQYKQLDYLLLSKSLAKKNSTVMPELVRSGLPIIKDEFTAAGFPKVDNKADKASDHCPVIIEIEL